MKAASKDNLTTHGWVDSLDRVEVVNASSTGGSENFHPHDELAQAPPAAPPLEMQCLEDFESLQVPDPSQRYGNLDSVTSIEPIPGFVDGVDALKVDDCHSKQKVLKSGSASSSMSHCIRQDRSESELSKELKVMIDTCHDRIIAHIDSRLSLCERRLTDKISESSLAAPTAMDPPSFNYGRPGGPSAVVQLSPPLNKFGVAANAPPTRGSAQWKQIMEKKLKGAFGFTRNLKKEKETLVNLLPSSEQNVEEVESKDVSKPSPPKVVNPSPPAARESNTLVISPDSNFIGDELRDTHFEEGPDTTAWDVDMQDEDGRRRGAAFTEQGRGEMSITAGEVKIKATGIFANSEDMKEKLRREMLAPRYDVCDLYKTTGFCQRIARHQVFEYVTLAVITLNALWMWIDTDYNDQSVLTNAHLGFQLGEHLFCIYFTTEWTLRFLSFKSKGKSLTDGWFCLDSLLVAMMVFETWIMTVIYLIAGTGSSSSGLGNASILRLLRLLRLTRMVRLAKLLRAMPELMIIIKGMLIAARTVFFMILLLICTVYVFAIAFRQITDGTAIGGEYFQTVPKSMVALLLRGNLPDVQEFVEDVSAANLFFGFFLLLFIFIGSITLLNMLLGVLVEVVTVVAQVEKEQLTILYVKDTLEKAFLTANLGTSVDHKITRDDFAELLTHPVAYKALASVGVDVVGLLDFSDFIFQGNTALTFSDFVEIVLQLRGSNGATVKDLVDLRLFLGTEIKQMKASLLSLSHFISAVGDTTQSVDTPSMAVRAIMAPVHSQ